MTTQEKRCLDALMPRVEKFARQWCPDWQNASIELTAEIQQIIDDAWGKDDRDHFEKVRKRAAELAYEDAAKIAERCESLLPDEAIGAKRQAAAIALMIRARAKEVAAK